MKMEWYNNPEAWRALDEYGLLMFLVGTLLFWLIQFYKDGVYTFYFNKIKKWWKNDTKM